MKLIHNWALVAPNSLTKVLEASNDLGAQGKAMGFVPEIPEVLAAPPQVAPGPQSALYLTVSEEPGDYPYVCTFPGLARSCHQALYNLILEYKSHAAKCRKSTNFKLILEKNYIPAGKC